MSIVIKYTNILIYTTLIWSYMDFMVYFKFHFIHRPLRSVLWTGDINIHKWSFIQVSLCSPNRPKKPVIHPMISAVVPHVTSPCENGAIRRVRLIQLRTCSTMSKPCCYDMIQVEMYVLKYEAWESCSSFRSAWTSNHSHPWPLEISFAEENGSQPKPWPQGQSMPNQYSI